MPKLSYPDCWLLWLPPTSNPFIRTPDAWPRPAQISVAVGTPTSLSLVKSVPTLVFCMSTTGEAADTVTDSCRVATCIWLSTVRI